MTRTGDLQQAILDAYTLTNPNQFVGDLHALCDQLSVPAGAISGRIIQAAQTYDSSITTSAAAIEYLLNNPSQVGSELP